MNKEAVLNLERELQFSKFTHEIGLKIALDIIENVQEHKRKGVSIRIVYEGLLIFQYLMDGRKESPWLKRKEKTVLDSGHSSLLTFVMSDENPEYQKWMKDETYAVCGGGFPITEKNEVKGAICVSGLHHEEDHRLIVDALKKFT
ncbi:heme-binding protein [Lachnospiraceae bacterium 54-53]